MPPRPFTPKVVTASDLLEGDVVYLRDDGAWTRDLSAAILITDEADAQLRLLEAERQADQVVGPYLADMVSGPDGPEPIHFREEFRRTGPGNYAHGKQVELRDV
ncbi:MAG: DUF2849 domain-containing protein [Pseudomonadota bacterium]